MRARCLLLVILLALPGVARAGDDGALAVSPPPPNSVVVPPVAPALSLTTDAADASYAVRATDRLGQKADCTVGYGQPRCSLTLSPGPLTLQIVRQPNLAPPESVQTRIVELPPRPSGLRLRQHGNGELIAGLVAVAIGAAVIAASLAAYPPGTATNYDRCGPLVGPSGSGLDPVVVAEYDRGVQDCRSNEDVTRYGVLGAGIGLAVSGLIVSGVGLATAGLHLDPL